MKIIHKFSLFLLLIGGVLSLKSCYYDVEDELYPGGCITENEPTYSQTVEPIISANCYGCHTTGSTVGGGIVLDSHAKLSEQVNNGKLLCSIKHQACASPMPQGGAKLNTCLISEIESWIDAGAQNN